MTHLNQKSFPIWLSIISFAIGTFLFVSYYIFDGYDRDNVLISGLTYTMFAIVVNSITLIYLIFQYFMHPVKRELIMVEGFFLLANIPIAVLYFYLILTNFNNFQLF